MARRSPPPTTPSAAIPVPNRCRVVFYPRSLEGLNGGLGGADVSALVMQLQVSRSVNRTDGTWSLTLLANPGDTFAISGATVATTTTPDALPLSALQLKENTPVVIGVERDGGLCLGLVDRVQRQVNRSGGQVQHTLTVTGRTIGKVLTQDQIAYGVLATPQTGKWNDTVQRVLGEGHPLLVPLQGLWGPEDKDGAITFQARSVTEVAEWALDFCPSVRIPLLQQVFGGEGKPGDFVEIEGPTDWNEGRVWGESVYTQWGTFDGFLRQVLDLDLYEVRVDERPRDASPIPQPVLVIRPRPWDDDDLEFAPLRNDARSYRSEAPRFVDPSEGAHQLNMAEVKGYTLGHGDEAYSYYVVTSAHIIAGTEEARAEGLFYPLLDLWAARKFGIRQYSARMNLVTPNVVAKYAGDGDYLQSELEELRDFRDRLFNWHRLAPEYERGTITVLGRDDYRPGDYVDLADYTPHRGGEAGTRFYVESVSHYWQSGGTYTTTLEVIRGYNAALVRDVKREIAELYEDLSARTTTTQVTTPQASRAAAAGSTNEETPVAPAALNPSMWVSA